MSPSFSATNNNHTNNNHSHYTKNNSKALPLHPYYSSNNNNSNNNINNNHRNYHITSNHHNNNNNYTNNNQMNNLFLNNNNTLILCKHWDNSSHSNRIKLLNNFYNTYHSLSFIEIESKIDTYLLYTRILSYFQLNYLYCKDLSIQIKVIDIFISGYKPLIDFIEIGGTQILLEILNFNKINKKDKISSLQCLQKITTNGRKFKEVICYSNGINLLKQSILIPNIDNDLIFYFKILINSLLKGNLKYYNDLILELFNILNFILNNTINGNNYINSLIIISNVFKELKGIEIIQLKESINILFIGLQSTEIKIVNECLDLIKLSLIYEDLNFIYLNNLLNNYLLKYLNNSFIENLFIGICKLLNYLISINNQYLKIIFNFINENKIIKLLINYLKNLKQKNNIIIDGMKEFIYFIRKFNLLLINNNSINSNNNILINELNIYFNKEMIIKQLLNDNYLPSISFLLSIEFNELLNKNDDKNNNELINVKNYSSEDEMEVYTPPLSPIK
ncbi:hypothetical protein ABK040_007322 [Willaertia magna]